MLVGLVDGVVSHGSEQEEVDFAKGGLLETRLAMRTPEGIRATELGRRVRTAELPWLQGAGRAWFGPEEVAEVCGASDAESEDTHQAECG